MKPSDISTVSHYVHVICNGVVKTAVGLVDSVRDMHGTSQLSLLFPSTCLAYINAQFQNVSISIMQASQRPIVSDKSLSAVARMESNFLIADDGVSRELTI